MKNEKNYNSSFFIHSVLLLLLQLESDGRLVAYFCRAKVLNWTWIDVLGFASPFITLACKVLEWCAIEFDECLANYRLHLTIATLEVHHHSDRHTTCNPFSSRSGCVLDDRHVARLAVSDEARSVEAQRVAVVCIVVGWSCATSLVAEEVVLRSELSYILACLLPLVELGSYHGAKQFLGLDETYLNVSVRVTVECKLTSHARRERVEDSEVLSGDVLLHEVNLLAAT